MDVQLKPEWPGGDGGDLLNAAIGKRTGGHQCTRHTCTASGRALALCMCQPVIGTWRDQYRHTHRSTQDGGAYVDVAHIDEHAWAQANTLERAAVCSQRHLVIATAMVVVPGGCFNECLGGCLIFVDVD